MVTRRNDSEGWRRGAMGIDGDSGWDFTKDDVADRKHQFDRSWNLGNLKKSDFQAMDCKYLEEGASGSELLDNARVGNRPLLGKGTPEEPYPDGLSETPAEWSLLRWLPDSQSKAHLGR
jgi:hypothetical protein